jgi:tetraacyldisaccharide 4'-kinase
VGNLVIGGSGKTPFVIALAKHFSDRKVAIISRGYGRQSSGLIEVSCVGKILTTVQQSGDEPMLIAKSLPQASMIVSENRDSGIEFAIVNGAEIIILDDGFNRVGIDKFEILLEPENMPNTLPLPSGPLREFTCSRRYADMVARENIDFKRRVRYQKLNNKMVLITAIANPKRLDKYLPDGVIKKIYIENHAYFSESYLKELLQRYGADSVLVTEKDFIKMEQFELPISVMLLEVNIDDSILDKIDKST